MQGFITLVHAVATVSVSVVTIQVIIQTSKDEKSNLSDSKRFCNSDRSMVKIQAYL